MCFNKVGNKVKIIEIFVTRILTLLKNLIKKLLKYVQNKKEKEFLSSNL